MRAMRKIALASWSERCMVAPSPELAERLSREIELLRGRTDGVIARYLTLGRKPMVLGLDDGVIIPPDQYPFSTPESVIRNAAAERAPLTGTVRVIVVLVDFSDKPMTATVEDFHDLFFSTGIIPHGSVKEYYTEVSNGSVDIVGEVVGPFRMPQTLAWYANGNGGIALP